MKYKIQFILFFAFAMAFTSCLPEEDIVEYQPETNLTRNEDLNELIINTPKVSFQANEPGYDIDFYSITPDNNNFQKIEIYKAFTDAATKNVSDRVLLTTYEVPAGVNFTPFEDNFTYEELSEGIVINGAGLPTDQSVIPVGSKWTLFVEPVGADGTRYTAPLNPPYTIEISVLSPFAGSYVVTESAYYRIGVESGISDWSGQERFIGSIDENTFAYVDAWGPFQGPVYGFTGEMLFDIDLTTNIITVLDDPSQLFFSGDEMLTCDNDAGQFANVPCTGSNVLIPSPDGKHVIKLTYGYFTTGSGPREFYEVMEKKVN